MKLAFIVEYDGSAFKGWQRQAGRRTVQGVLEDALSRVADQPLQLAAAGRTDSGVHATAQVIHIEADAIRTPRAWLFGTNTWLPRDVALRWCKEVPADFHARFSARARSYRYLILNRTLRPALMRERCAWECRTLDAQAMHEAAACLLGTHDFSAFRAAACQAASPVHTVSSLAVRREGDLIVVEIKADAFLHNMVRIIVGNLLQVGRGERSTGDIRELLECGERRLGGPTAPAQGLYLSGVDYPPHYGIAAFDAPGDSGRFLLI